jgi:hypothetical protein
VLAISGLIVGGVSTYFFIRSGRRPSRSASIVPTSNGGAMITWGGSL